LILDQWIKALEPVRHALAPPLRAIFKDPVRAEARYVAACVLADFLAADASSLVELLVDADPRQLGALLPRLEGHRDRVTELLEAELALEPAAEAPEAEQDARARRKANVAAALLALGQGERVWPLLAHRPDSRLRTCLIHLLGPAGIDPQAVLGRLEHEADVSVRRALLLSLGEYDDDALSAAQRQTMAGHLLATYRDDPDPGIHSAVAWLLRRRGRAADLAPVDRVIASPGPRGPRRWFINRQGQTMAVVRGPVELVMELGPELRQPMVIPRTFALGTAEVTVEQFRHSRRSQGLDVDSASDSALPVDSISWFEAARYCRWLSEQEGIPEDQMCYPPLDQIRPGMQLYPDYLKRTGYRLPTEAEWVYACAGTASTIRPYGNDDRWLSRYAWSVLNSDGHTWPVGLLQPNDLGCFDMLGNVVEWCHGDAQTLPIPLAGGAVVDREDPASIGDGPGQFVRGGAFDSRLKLVRTSYRNGIPPDVAMPWLGFRVARTCE
jgi:hypothetical protein